MNSKLMTHKNCCFRPLTNYDMRKSWTIEASLMCNLLETEQIYLYKEDENGQLAGDAPVNYKSGNNKIEYGKYI